MDKMLDFLEVMNQSKTTSKNYKEVIESLYKVAPCKTYLFSWHDHTKYETPKASCVEDKVDLTEKLGMWTTRHILYIYKNGSNYAAFELKLHLKIGNQRKSLTFINLGNE